MILLAVVLTIVFIAVATEMGLGMVIKSYYNRYKKKAKLKKFNKLLKKFN